MAVGHREAARRVLEGGAMWRHSRSGWAVQPCAANAVTWFLPMLNSEEQIFDLLIHEGLPVGTCSGINVAAAIRVARAMRPGHTIVTVLCDGGARYASKPFSPEFQRDKGLPVPGWLV
jgi:hypothetical protein